MSTVIITNRTHSPFVLYPKEFKLAHEVRVMPGQSFKVSSAVFKKLCNENHGKNCWNFWKETGKIAVSLKESDVRGEDAAKMQMPTSNLQMPLDLQGTLDVNGQEIGPERNSASKSEKIHVTGEGIVKADAKTDGAKTDDAKSTTVKSTAEGSELDDASDDDTSLGYTK